MPDSSDAENEVLKALSPAVVQESAVPFEVFHCRPQCHVELSRHAWLRHEGAK